MGNTVMIRTNDGQLVLSAEQGQKPPMLTGGIGGWTTVTRPRKTALTIYEGHNPFQLVLNLMFDGFQASESQERKIRTLIWMALPPTDGEEPRPVEIIGALPFPSGGLWVINDIAYGDNVVWADDEQYRIRQDVDITLMQYIRPDRVAFKDLQLGRSPGKSKVINALEGDTCKKISVRYFHTQDRYRDIADLNNIRDPAQKFKKGDKVRIPVDAPKSNKAKTKDTK